MSSRGELGALVAVDMAHNKLHSDPQLHPQQHGACRGHSTRLSRALWATREGHMCAHVRCAIEPAHEPLESESHGAYTTRKSMEEQG